MLKLWPDVQLYKAGVPPKYRILPTRLIKAREDRNSVAHLRNEDELAQILMDSFSEASQQPNGGYVGFENWSRDPYSWFDGIYRYLYGKGIQDMCNEQP